MTRLHLGAGRDIRPDWINVDLVAAPGIDLVIDLDQPVVTLPFHDDTVAEVHGAHFLEHLRNPLPLMDELYRVARPDATATFVVPYGSSDDAFEDPTHHRQLFLNSWAYFAQPTYAKADYGYRGDWQVERIVLSILESVSTRYANRDEMLHAIKTERNIVHEMTATLRAVKPARPQAPEANPSPAALILQGLIISDERSPSS